MRTLPLFPGVAVVAAAVLLPATLHADAIVRTMAMKASTIAEYFVEDGQVAVELEVGAPDLNGFRNLLPDELYSRLGHEVRPLRERFRELFERDLVVAIDGGDPLPARIVALETRTRVIRDDITGEPLPGPEGEEEIVLFARLEYPTPERPERVTIGGEACREASIGFLVYHEGIAVNDFRYLTLSQTMQLDWEDPWYSQFASRSLKRSYSAPMSGFLYVEPYEVRKEIILRPKDLQHWIDLGLGGRETIPVEMQDEMKRKVAEFLRVRQTVLIDGRKVEPDLAQINFLERTLRSSRVIDPPVELSVNRAILGAIFVYPTEGLPQVVTLDWDLFNDRIQAIPTAAVDQAGPLPTILEPDFRVLEWKNFLTNPQLPTLTVLAPPPSAIARLAGIARWVLLVAAAGFLAWSWRRPPGARTLGVAGGTVLVLLSATSFWLAREAGLSDERTRHVTSGLLHNIYRAFDFREDERIYDVLEQSIQGDLLTRVYLETRRGLELANQGGARAKVKSVDLEELDVERGQGGGFLATATWNVAGSVGHWGHVHQRQNRYQAHLEIQPVDGRWKLTDLEILEEVRL